MNKSTPSLISVLMPVYDGEKYLAEAIESILNQTYKNFEFIIVNDGSTDKSREIILSYTDDRIKYIENEKNIGIVNTLNKGIELAKGQIIARMDADDISHPQRLEYQLSYMDKNPEVGVCGSWVTLIDEAGNATGNSINQTKSEFIKLHLLFSVPLIHPSVSIKAELLKENLYEPIIAAEDYDLWCRLEDKTEFANIPNQLLSYRWHSTNISKEKATIQQKSKDSIILNQLKKIGLVPTKEEFRIHKLSFSLYSFDGKSGNQIDSSDLVKTGNWFKKIVIANKREKKYKKNFLAAFLWSRWVVLCLALNKKIRIFNPPFTSYNPIVLIHLLKQLFLLSKKKIVK